MKKINKTTLFLILTFFINWAMIGIYSLAGGEWNTIGANIIAIAYMFIPLIVVLIISKLIYKEAVISKYQISFRLNIWFLAALLLPVIIALGTFGISLLFPGINYSPDLQGFFSRYESSLSPEQMEQMKSTLETLPIHPIWFAVLNGLLAGATINAIAAFGEELGWRGFLLHQFRNLSFVKGSLLIGFIWGIWHAPLILSGHNYPEHPYIGVVMMIIWCILLSFFFNYIRLKARSTIAAAVMHGTVNASYGIAVMFIAGGNELLIGITGFSGFLALIAIIGGLFAYDQWFTAKPIWNEQIIEAYE